MRWREPMRGKLRSKWSGPFKVTQVFESGVIKLENDKGERFKANGQRIKAYLGVSEDVKIIEECRTTTSIATGDNNKTSNIARAAGEKPWDAALFLLLFGQQRGGRIQHIRSVRAKQHHRF
ncbi:hypothetical protein H5410_027437 [Solanum commersonii]|uniref:Uncharacterized protein n=1 Tax=Solanum commersonii TaxID=4109 RepID=A0A9J5YZ69_SOLCO|nr:hypothetical protein H5410_027437 [Solanum commersonii]